MFQRSSIVFSFWGKSVLRPGNRTFFFGQSHDRPDPQSCNTLDPIRGCDFRYTIRCGAGETLIFESKQFF